MALTIDRRAGGRPSPAQSTAQEAHAFALCRRRLERALAASCQPEQPWAARVVAGINTALEFAAANPTAAQVLTAHATVHRFGSRAAFEHMVAHFARLLYSSAPAPARRPLADPGDVVTRIASQISYQLEHAPVDQIVAIAPDLIVYVLTSRVGSENAKHHSSGRPS